MKTTKRSNKIAKKITKSLFGDPFYCSHCGSTHGCGCQAKIDRERQREEPYYSQGHQLQV